MTEAVRVLLRAAAVTRGLLRPLTREERDAGAVVAGWTPAERRAHLDALRAEAPDILADLARARAEQCERGLRLSPEALAVARALHARVRAMSPGAREERALTLVVLAQRRYAAARGRPDPFRAPDGLPRIGP
jgi:hypothetical protein